MTLQAVHPGEYTGDYVVFRSVHVPNRKTQTWVVCERNEDETPLAEIKWFPRWRKYCFFPIGDTVFEEKCLGDIAEFITTRTKEHRKSFQKAIK
jgi:hypothetical protein